MENHHQLTDTEFESQFQDCTLAPTLFTHEAHLRFAWIQVIKNGEEQACKNICSQILSFDNVHGKGDKFNKTITIASAKAVNHFIQKSTSHSFAEFIKEFPCLKYNFMGLLSCHYDKGVFNSDLAKTTFIEPDLLSF